MGLNYMDSILTNCIINGRTSELINEIKDESSSLSPSTKLILLKLAEDDEDGLFLLAEAYYEGVLLKKNIKKSLEFYEKAARKGNVQAHLELGWHYYRCREYGRAMEWFQRCIEKADCMSDDDLGNCYANLGDCSLRLPSPNYTKAIEFLSIACNKFQNLYSAYRLGTIYSNKEIPLCDMRKAKEFYEIAANRRHEKASILMAEYYAYGNDEMGIDVNVDRSRTLLAPHYNSDETEILVRIGNILLNNVQESSDYAQIISLFQKALEKNDYYNDGYIESLLGYALCMDGQYSQGLDYLLKAHDCGFYNYSGIIGNAYCSAIYEDLGIEKNDVLAAQYYAKAFENKSMNVFQCGTYAEMLADETSTACNYSSAYEVAEYGIQQFNDVTFYFVKSKLVIEEKVNQKANIYDALKTMEELCDIEYICMKAHSCLAEYYMKNKDYRKAETHYIRAFEAGDGEAGLKLARMYEKGIGSIQASVSHAVEWYKKAAATGNETAQKEVECFVEKLFGGYRRVKNI